MSEPVGPVDLYLARHGETEWSRDGRHTGLTDLPLVPEGAERARSLGGRLAGIHFAAVYSSPLARACQTAALAGFPEPRLEPALVEWDYGEYDGVTSAQIKERRPDWNLWRDGAPGGEAPDAIYARARSLLARLLSRGETPLLLFSHGHFLRVFTVAFLGLPIGAGELLPLSTAALSMLRQDGERGPQLELWNFTGRLG